MTKSRGKGKVGPKPMTLKVKAPASATNQAYVTVYEGAAVRKLGSHVRWFKELCMSGVGPWYVQDAFAKAGNGSFALVVSEQKTRTSRQAVAMAKCSCVVHVGASGKLERVVLVDLVCSTRRGLGRVLMDHIAALAVEYGATLLVLSSVPDQWKTYSKWGFVRGTGLAIDLHAKNAANVLLDAALSMAPDHHKIPDMSGIDLGSMSTLGDLREYMDVLALAGPVGYYGNFNAGGLVAMHRRVPGVPGPSAFDWVYQTFARARQGVQLATVRSAGGKWVNGA